MGSHDDELVRRHIDTETEDPASEIALLIADLEGRKAEALDPSWRWIDDVLEHIFSTPPKPEAQVEVKFSYEGYRITVTQDGTVTFVKV